MEKKNMKKKLKKLVEMRQMCANYGNVAGIQAVNYEIARIARKLGLDYYTI